MGSLAEVDPSRLAQWNELVRLAQSPPQIAASFASDPDRGKRAAIEVPVGDEALLVDVSRQHVDVEVVAALIALAEARGWSQRRDAMFAGEPVNVSEGRAALHVALRATLDESYAVEPTAAASAAAEWERVCDFAEAVRSGSITGARGTRLRHVVAVGIGGSDLGPRLVHGALSSSMTPDLDCRFVSSLDPSARERALDGCDPAATLVVVCSKTFTTRETMRNAAAIRAWLAAAVGPEAAIAQTVGVSAVEPGPGTLEVGHWFRIWPWVGGRFSLASAMALTNVVAFGAEPLTQLLAGMRAMDRHVMQAPAVANAPLVLGMLSVWNRTFLGRATRAVVAYGEALGTLPAYLQQLEMESNGKSVREDGTPVDYPTGPVVWGGSGPEAQHAFMQLLHQGTEVVPVDFVGVADSATTDPEAHRELLANLVAQADTLALGRAGGAHDTLAGNRPSTIVLLSAMTPACLGALVALYEHAVVMQAALWGIDPFDQWGVEEGKRRAAAIMGGATDATLPTRAHGWRSRPPTRS